MMSSLALCFLVFHKDNLKSLCSPHLSVFNRDELKNKFLISLRTCLWNLVLCYTYRVWVFKMWVESMYRHDVRGTSWHMHTSSKIRVYHFSQTKSLLWPTQGQREDADCWYFCLFKLFTHSETTLILVCGMLAVGDCRAVWRTDGLSKKPVRKTHSQLWQGSFCSSLDCEISHSFFVSSLPWWHSWYLF